MTHFRYINHGEDVCQNRHQVAELAFQKKVTVFFYLQKIHLYADITYLLKHYCDDNTVACD